MAKTLKYIPKTTSAKTEYRELSDSDRTWLIIELNKWLVKMAVLSNTNDPKLKQIRDDFWRTRITDLPAGRSGKNTAESMIAGILDNILYSATPQRDFTDKQCDAIELISECLSIYDNNVEEIRFQIGII